LNQPRHLKPVPNICPDGPCKPVQKEIQQNKSIEDIPVSLEPFVIGEIAADSNLVAEG
jgi:hypothetical protein